jgi:hypothetical protein
MSKLICHRIIEKKLNPTCQNFLLKVASHGKEMIYFKHCKFQQDKMYMNKQSK